MKKSLTALFIFLNIFLLNTQFLAQWVELNSGVSVKLNSLSSIKELTTWACGNNGTVIKSSNMGDNWTNGNQSGITANITLNHIYCINENIVLTAGNDGSVTYLYRTINGGASWDVVKQQTGGKFNALHFIDNNTGILIGDPVGGRWSIWKTVNGGINWDSTGCYLPQNGNEKGYANSLWASGNNIWFGTDNFRVYKTDNYALSWQTLSTGTEKNSASLWFDFDFNIGLSGNTNLIRTINSGNNWSIEPLPGSGNIISTTGSAHSRFNWVIRSDNRIYLNPHNSNNWVHDYTAPNGNYTYISIERNGYFSGAVFALRDNGGISRTYFLSLGINTISTSIPENFRLEQNFPNPFNPVTKIRFEIPAAGYVNLSIFDVMGQKIETLVNGKMMPGVFEAEFNASKLNSGVYFCRLSTENFSETKKMILIK
ncbi:MAG TPA: T9SS type A sorting domain-containing protein [Ignavibacteria bacterium]|nr:T9SS type A sorting domain-containing protein [Ignavibacteria bacterium]